MTDEHTRSGGALFVRLTGAALAAGPVQAVDGFGQSETHRSCGRAESGAGQPEASSGG